MVGRFPLKLQENAETKASANLGDVYVWSQEGVKDTRRIKGNRRLKAVDRNVTD